MPAGGWPDLKGAEREAVLMGALEAEAHGFTRGQRPQTGTIDG